jgi:nitrogen fixation protein
MKNFLTILIVLVVSCKVHGQGQVYYKPLTLPQPQYTPPKTPSSTDQYYENRKRQLELEILEKQSRLLDSKNSSNNANRKITFKLLLCNAVDKDYQLKGQWEELEKDNYISIDREKVTLYIPELDINMNITPLNTEDTESGTIINLKNGGHLYIGPKEDNFHVLVLYHDEGGAAFVSNLLSK